jgi:GH25 family lysozyme M1 (1,4-beta-N-acetylmuramidase)
MSFGIIWHKTCTINGMIIGIDISEKNSVTAWADIAKNQVRFAYLKCTDGITSTVAAYASDKKAAKTKRNSHRCIPLAQSKQDAAAQADFFLKNASITSDDLPPVVCLELYTTKKQCLNQSCAPSLKPLKLVLPNGPSFIPPQLIGNATWRELNGPV